MLKSIFKFLLLVIILNVARYVVGFPFEKFLLLDRLFGAMERSSSYFNIQYSTFDWVTSYFYNFMMWFATTLVFVLLGSKLKGSYILRSLKVYALMFLMFASVSAIYMNHYSHPKDFYFYNILDGLIVFCLVATVNGLIYPRVFKTEIAQESLSQKQPIS